MSFRIDFSYQFVRFHLSLMILYSRKEELIQMRERERERDQVPVYDTNSSLPLQKIHRSPLQVQELTFSIQLSKHDIHQ